MAMTRKIASWPPPIVATMSRAFRRDIRSLLARAGCQAIFSRHAVAQPPHYFPIYAARALLLLLPRLRTTASRYHARSAARPREDFAHIEMLASGAMIKRSATRAEMISNRARRQVEKRVGASSLPPRDGATPIGQPDSHAR